MPRSKSRNITGVSASESKPKKARSAAKKSKTTMMDQYWKAKKEQPDAILFFRMGDFYELFHDDAVLASRELGITLTSRSKGEDPVPMAGVPVRSMEGYLIRLVRKGFRVAICEQLTDPRKTKGIVERGIVRVVTPGTLTEENALEARQNNYLLSLWCKKDEAALAWVDLSTGRFEICAIGRTQLMDELARIQPAELLLSSSLDDGVREELNHVFGNRICERDDWRFARDTTERILLRHFGVSTLAGYGIEADNACIPAAGALIEYLEETQKSACEHIRSIKLIEPEQYLVLDRATRSCLELTSTQLGERSEGTLLDTIDATLTPMGGRLMREWVLAPLRVVEQIRERQHAVTEFVDAPFLREEVREALRDVLDLERLVAKVSTGRANGRDLRAIASSMNAIAPVRERLDSTQSKALCRIRTGLDPLRELTLRIESTLVEAPPMTIREGGLICTGFHAELDELHQIAGDGKTWMARFQAKEMEATGMTGLKVGYNSVFGYYLEVPRGQVERVPENYIRKQTIKTAERYITPELKDYEGKVLKAEQSSRDLEYELFLELREEVAQHVRQILDTASCVAELDVYGGLAQKAAENRYVAPCIDDTDVIDIADGRHPVIEQSSACDAFVPNDSRLNGDDRNLTILTGPNMAGKSTFIRQTALIVLMAQIGSFVPASEARIGVADRIFTRVGAGDDISRGASTFMVEMIEIANILNNASKRSLVVLDEVGRGTSTFDGLALAWAIAEHVHEEIGARTIFATHYHQLTEMEARFRGVSNLSVAVRELGEEIVFLHKIVEGGTDRSYGIHVARLAGVPATLLERAKSLLNRLERESDELGPIASAPGTAGSTGAPVQLGLFQSEPSLVEENLRSLDLNSTTPLEALAKLAELKALLP